MDETYNLIMSVNLAWLHEFRQKQNKPMRTKPTRLEATLNAWSMEGVNRLSPTQERILLTLESESLDLIEGHADALREAGRKLDECSQGLTECGASQGRLAAWARDLQAFVRQKLNIPRGIATRDGIQAESDRLKRQEKEIADLIGKLGEVEREREDIWKALLDEVTPESPIPCLPIKETRTRLGWGFSDRPCYHSAISFNWNEELWRCVRCGKEVATRFGMMEPRDDGGPKRREVVYLDKIWNRCCHQGIKRHQRVTVTGTTGAYTYRCQDCGEIGNYREIVSEKP